MNDAHALMIAVDEAAGLPDCPFAGAELTALARQFEAAGVAKDRLVSLSGRTATRAGVESRLRRLAQAVRPGDVVWFVFAGPAFVESGCTFLACFDTLADDRTATALALDAVWRQLEPTGAMLRLVLDAAGHSSAELRELFQSAGPHVALVACSEPEVSHAGAGRRLWLQLVATALAGRAPDAVRAGQLVSGPLQTWIAAELPRRLRKAVSAPVAQTPALYGNPAVALAAVPTVLEQTPKLSLKQLRRIVFRGTARQRLKDLSGFHKSYKLPESATPSAQKWACKIAAADLQAAIDSIYNAVREQFGFKRKDLEANVGNDGLGFIRTPQFDYSVSVGLDPDDPTMVIWRREIGQIAAADVLTAAAFRDVFGAFLDTLEFEFQKPIDVAAFVDRLEDDPPPGTAIRVASAGGACEITVAGFAGSVHIEKTHLRITGRSARAPDSLVAQFMSFQAQFGGRKGLQPLGL